MRFREGETRSERVWEKMVGNWKRWEIRRRERRCETENTGFLDLLEVNDMPHTDANVNALC